MSYKDYKDPDSKNPDYNRYYDDSKNPDYNRYDDSKNSDYKADSKKYDSDDKRYYNDDAKSNNKCMTNNDLRTLISIISKYNIAEDNTTHHLYNKSLDALKKSLTTTPDFNIHEFPIFKELKNVITKCVDDTLQGGIGPIKIQISWLLIDKKSFIDFITDKVGYLDNLSKFDEYINILKKETTWKDFTKNTIINRISTNTREIKLDEQQKENIKKNWDKIRLYFMDIEPVDKSSKEVKGDSKNEKTVDVSVDEIATLAASYLKLIGFFRIKQTRMEKIISVIKKKTGNNTVTPKNYLKKIFNLNDNQHFKDVNLMKITGETAKKHLECNKEKAKEFGKVIEDIFENKKVNDELTPYELDYIIEYFEIFCNTYNPSNNVIKCINKDMPCDNNKYGGNSYNGGDHIAPGKDDIISSKPVKQNVKKNTKKKRKEKKRKVSKQKRIKYRNKNRTKIKKGSKIQTKKRKI